MNTARKSGSKPAPPFRHSVFPLIWTCIVGLLCGLPGNSFPDLSLWALLRFDSFAHAFVFALFSFLWAVAFAKQEKYYLLRRYSGVYAALLGAVYGVILEFAQYYIFFRRSAEWTDMVSDGFGALIGWMLFTLVYWPVLKERKSNKAL